MHNRRYLAALLALGSMPLTASAEQADRLNPQTYNMSEEEIAERDRPISRQERRQMARLKLKGR